MVIDRDKLHELINEVAPDDFDKVYKILQAFTDDEWIADNSPLTEDEREAIKTSEEQIAEGDVVSWEDIKRRK